VAELQRTLAVEKSVLQVQWTWATCLICGDMCSWLRQKEQRHAAYYHGR